MTYFLTNASPLSHLQQIGDKGAYTTQAEETSKKAILSYQYEAKRNICIVSIVAIVALAAILGVTKNPYLSLIVSGTFVPIGAWSYFKAKHSNLEKLHQIDFDSCIALLSNLSTYMYSLRENKIVLLDDILAKSPKDQELQGALKTEEIQYDKKTDYPEVCEYAKNARQVISKHYQHVGDGTGPVANFLNACDALVSPKQIIVVTYHSYDKCYKAGWKNAHSHPYTSLLPGPQTKWKEPH